MNKCTYNFSAVCVFALLSPWPNKVFIITAVCNVTAVAWDPKQSRLALCAGTNKVYMWSPKGSLSVQIPCEGDLHIIEILSLQV